jgi:predicted nucleic acid-binding protein
LKYWDSSALVSLFVQERPTSQLRRILDDDSDQTVWYLASVEIASALSRRSREGMGHEDESSFRSVWKGLSEHWREITALDPVRSRAHRLLNVHVLRAGDALQLAAALVACEDKPEALPFVCLDDRLRDAARREGFPVLP